MILCLKPYPAYKPSGVEWLGEVPARWHALSIKNLARRGHNAFVDGDWIESPYITSDGIRLIQTGNIGVGTYREKGFRYISEKTFLDLRCTEVHVGDLLICRLGDPVSRACLAPDLNKRMITSVDVCILQPRKEIAPEFLVYAMSSRIYLDWVRSLVRGSTRDRVSRSMLGSFRLPLPPLPEQQAIARYLDHVDERIRRYTDAKRRLIALLEEEREAIVSEAVTGQTDVRTGQPYPAYRPSGVEWLGEIPAHWDVRRLKTIADIRYGLGQPPAESTEGLPLIRATNVERGKIVREGLIHVDPTSVPVGRDAFLKEHEIIVVRSGAYTADSAIIPKSYEGAVAGYDMVLTSKGAQPHFIAKVFLSRYLRDEQLIPTSTRSAQPHLNAEELGAALVLLPPLPEQQAIVEYLETATARIDTAIVRAKRQIELVEEYRTRLISDVVTGKLDVREASAQLPDKNDD